jgi:peptide/nickel transport system permease protein
MQSEMDQQPTADEDSFDEDIRPIPPLRTRFWRFAQRKPLGAVSAGVLLVLVLMAAFAPVIAPYDPLLQRGVDRLQAPSLTHFMGTDQAGRDIFSRVIYGARTSLYVGFVAITIGTVVGTTVGILSGYLGGRFDLWLQRLVDVLMGFPFIVLALVLVVALGPSTSNVALALSVAVAPRVIRLARSSALAIKQEMYVMAAISIGSSVWRIVFRHVLPNALGPVFVVATGSLGGVIVAEAGLSFLGLGVPPPAPSWGGMLNTGARGYMEVAPWMVVFPGVALSLVVFTFSLLGDALRDVFDPRLRARE